MISPGYHLQIITPQGIAYEASVVHARIPVEKGSVGILANHAAYVTASPGGILEIREVENAEEKRFAVGPGFFEVNRNRAAFFAASCQSGLS